LSKRVRFSEHESGFKQFGADCGPKWIVPEDLKEPERYGAQTR
jgi:hypothetical protein